MGMLARYLMAGAIMDALVLAPISSTPTPRRGYTRRDGYVTKKEADARRSRQKAAKNARRRNRN